jgi:hypothetical protein
MRDFLFDAEASGGGSGGGGRGPSSPGLVAAAVVDPKIVRQVQFEHLRARMGEHDTRPDRPRRHRPIARKRIPRSSSTRRR